MQPFSIHCPTCKVRLRVRHPSAIGRVLNCPKCQSMVEVQPPPGWTFDPTETQARANHEIPDETSPMPSGDSATDQLDPLETTDESVDDPTDFDWAVAPERRRRLWLVVAFAPVFAGARAGRCLLDRQVTPAHRAVSRAEATAGRTGPRRRPAAARRVALGNSVHDDACPIPGRRGAEPTRRAIVHCKRR